MAQSQKRHKRNAQPITKQITLRNRQSNRTYILEAMESNYTQKVFEKMELQES